MPCGEWRLGESPTVVENKIILLQPVASMGMEGKKKHLCEQGMSDSGCSWCHCGCLSRRLYFARGSGWLLDLCCADSFHFHHHVGIQVGVELGLCKDGVFHHERVQVLVERVFVWTASSSTTVLCAAGSVSLLGRALAATLLGTGWSDRRGRLCALFSCRLLFFKLCDGSKSEENANVSVHENGMC